MIKLPVEEGNSIKLYSLSKLFYEVPHVDREFYKLITEEGTFIFEISDLNPRSYLKSNRSAFELPLIVLIVLFVCLAQLLLWSFFFIYKNIPSSGVAHF